MVKYYGFSDESGYTNEKYRSVGIVVMPNSLVNKINNKLTEILNKYEISSIKSFKWREIKSGKKYEALKDFLEYLFPLINNNKIFITVLIWDISDSRHKIKRRDDNKNLSIMYYKLIKHIAKNNLKNNGELHLYVDNTNGIIDWNRFEKILYNDGITIPKQPIQELVKTFTIAYKKVYIYESSTENKNLIQIADIFSGLARTSYLDYDKYKEWLNKEIKLSNREKYRFQIYNLILKKNKEIKLNITLDNKKGFYTTNINSSLNFWLYEPQGDYDKAPTK